MEYYVGLDVSLKHTSICVVNPTGSIVQEGVVDSDPEAIALFVRSRAPGTVRIGIETGPTTTWLWTELNRLGLPVICIDARHAKAVLKMQINKSDRNDAAGIARIMQTGWFKEVRVKDLDSHAVKALEALCLFDGNHALVADLLHSFGDEAADLGIAVCRDSRYLGDLLIRGDCLLVLLQILDNRINCEIDAPLQIHGVHAGSDRDTNGGVRKPRASGSGD
jgi:hypothetical protein